MSEAREWQRAKWSGGQVSYEKASHVWWWGTSLSSRDFAARFRAHGYAARAYTPPWAFSQASAVMKIQQNQFVKESGRQRQTCGASCCPQWVAVFDWSVWQLYFYYKVLLQLNTRWKDQNCKAPAVSVHDGLHIFLKAMILSSKRS